MSKIFAFSEAASIAIHGMVLIAKSNGVINVSHIAESICSSKHHVAKVLQRLVKENFISSQRGPTGGFILKKPASKISFLDIYEAIEGPMEIGKCPLDKPECHFDNCIMNNVTNIMEEDFKKYLKSQTLNKFVKKL
jgi:Rrf2 family protein